MSKGKSGKAAHISVIATTLAALLAAAHPAFADESHSFHIAAADASSAVREFANQSGVQIMASAEALRNKQLNPVVGEHTTEAALNLLLTDTGLEHRYIGERGVVIALVQPVKLAQADRSSTSSVDPSARELVVEEIIVTAQKRSEPLQEVPVPVAVIEAVELIENNQLRIQDYYNKVPGLNLTLLGDIGQSSLSIRGLTTGGNVLSTVGVVVDDIPFGPSIYVSNGSFAPDFDPGELARVEVLRGPQGTLYGANSLGGLLKFATIDPSADAVSGRVQLGTSSVHEGDELGHAVRAAVNLPLGDTVALRASGSMRREPGYIDNLQTGEEDVNIIDSNSGRLALLWEPADVFSLKLSALYQDTEQEGTADTHLPSPIGPRPDLQDLQQSTLIDSGIFGQEMQAYSATLTAQLGRAELISLSGYNIKTTFNALDTPLAFLTGPTQTRFGVSGFVTKADTEIAKLTQELRLSMPLTDRIEWLLGAFYTDEQAEGHSDWQAINQNTGAVAGTWLVVDTDSSYAEYAAFTDLTFRLSDRLDVQVGGRVSRNEVSAGRAITVGPYNTVLLGLPSETSITPAFESEDRPISYLLTPRFKLSRDLMVYARFASGYRPGGPNTSAAAVAAGAPASYEADMTQTYEIGSKGRFFGGMVAFDASIYHIDWKDVQLQARDPANASLQYTYNVGAAESQGVELSVELKPIDGMTIAAWGAYNDARLTEVPPTVALNARAGDRLPYSARKSGYFSVDQQFPLWADVVGHVGASASYVGNRKGRFFTGSIVQGEFPAYTQVDMQLGARFDAWTVNAFVNNVTDERGVLRGGRDASLGLQYIVTYIQPRTAGLTLTRSF